MNQCPTDEQLQALLAGTLGQADADALTEHVGECQKCETRLQQLAERGVAVDSFESFESLVAESVAAAPPAQSAYWNVRESFSDRNSVIREIAHGTTGDLADTNSRNDRSAPEISSSKLEDDVLAFLEPAEDPVYIGRLQQFLISRVIGRGGMGVVLEGFDPDLQRSVAIKVLHSKFQNDESSIERFCREGRAAAAISHEHVVPMHQVARVEDEGVAFLVMQLIEGKTLEDMLKEQSPMPPAESARIAMQMAAGLSAAHQQGLVHRDIKPGNILIEASTGRVKLTDFGLARINDEVKLTRTGMLLGTALYMSPEQALGNPVDERSDLFSLGAVMYEMATGKAAFDAPTPVGVMKLIMDKDPVPPHKVNPDVSKPTSDLIMQLLAKTPNKRPDSASAVAQALAAIVTEHGPISPLQVPVVASSEVKKLSKEHSVAAKTFAFGGWLLAATAIAGLVLVSLAGYRSGPTEPADGMVSVKLNSSAGDAEDVSDQFSWVTFSDNPGTVWSIDFSSDGQTIAAGIGDGSVRFWNIDQQKVARSFNAHAGNVWNVKFHPTLDLFATAGDDSWVKLWNLDTFDVTQGWKLDNTVRAIAFSPDGKTLAAGDRAGELHLYNVKTGREVESIKIEGTTILGIDYSHDGKFIAAAGSDKTVRVYDAQTLEQRQSFTGHQGPVYSVSFSQDSPLLASVGFKSETWIWNAETGQNVLKVDGLGDDNWAVGFCGGDRHLLTGGQDGTARFWDMDDGASVATFYGHTAAVHDFAFDRTGNRIATASRDGTIRVWDTSNLGSLTGEAMAESSAE